MIFASVMFAGLFQLSMGMEKGGAMSDCPFMEHGEVICTMSLTDHIGAWKAAFVSIAPTIVVLVMVAGTTVLLAIAPSSFLLSRGRLIAVKLNQLRTRTYSYTYRPLQELFSNGILHPKLF